MRDFIGINQDYKLYQDGTEKDFARVSKWLRDYAKWYCLEPSENSYLGVDGTGGCGTSPYFFNYNAFYTNMQAAGVNVLHVAEHSPAYANATGKNGDIVPLLKDGQGQKPDDFIKHAQYLYQLAALYGNNKNFPPNNLASNKQKPGQNFVQAIENWNEPDGWWKGNGQFSKEQFYNMLVADYDGDGGRLPKAGVKQADPNMKFVMGGLATNDLSYLYGVLGYANQQGKKFPADVLNFHHYDSDGKTGIPPEAGQSAKIVQEASKWRDSYVPDAEIWVTEFGWDTFAAKDGQHSTVYAGLQNQANWILRGLVLYRAAGVDKAFIFLFNDDEIDSPELYSSSGLLTMKNEKKPAYYYLATMQDMVGEMYLDRPVTTGREDVKAYLFRNPKGSNGVFTVWKNSGNGSKIDNFSLALPAGVSKNCTAVVPSNNSLNPARTPLTVTDGKITLPVSETMTFVACDDLGQATGAGAINGGAVANASIPSVGANGRIDLSNATLIETADKALDPESKPPFTALVNEQKIVPDDPQATTPQDSWYALNGQSSFAIDLQKGFDLGRLDWFNAGGSGSGFEVFSAPPGGFGKWQPLTTILNDGSSYGRWMSVQLDAKNVQFLQFVPKGTSGDAKLGELALYAQGATPLVQNQPRPAASATGAPAQSTPQPSGNSNQSAASFKPIGTPPAASGGPVVAAVPAEGRLAITSVAEQGGGNIRAAFDGKTDTDWRVPGKLDYAQFSLALDGIHTIETIRFFVNGTEHAPNTTIQASSDGQNWTTLKNADGINAGAKYGWNEIAADNIKARYLRFIIKNVPDATGDKIFELGYFGEVQVIGT
jgi:hypothetical protein